MTLEIYAGAAGRYLWLQSPMPRLFMCNVIDRFPEIVLGKFVAVASLDSTSYNPSDEEIRKGWVRRGTLAISPRITSKDEVPPFEFTECLVFPDMPSCGSVEPFVNYVPFHLSDRESAEPVEFQIELRRRFWIQVEALAPESYLAEGTELILVTRIVPLFSRTHSYVGAIGGNT